MSSKYKANNRIQLLTLRVVVDAYKLFVQEVKDIQKKLLNKTISLKRAKKAFKRSYLKYKNIAKNYV